MTEHVHFPVPCTLELMGMQWDGPADDPMLLTLNAYFARFAAPITHYDESGRTVLYAKCFHCGKPLNGPMAMFASTGFQFSLDPVARAQGKGKCAGCNWPAKAHHLVLDTDGSELLRLQNYALLYMPEHVGVA